MGKPHYGEFKFGKTPARPTSKGYAKGGETKGQAKVSKVMSEFKSGKLHSGSKEGPVVKNPKQAIAIALSEKKAAGYKKGGEPKLVGAKREPEAIVRKEIALLKKADAPAKIIKHEEKELASGYKKGGEVKKMQVGGPLTEGERARMSRDPVRKPMSRRPLTEKERQMVEEAEMDRKMKQADKDMPTNRRMLDEAMNPLGALKEAYDRMTDRSGTSATENMKRYGMKKGGEAKHEDIAKDKPLIREMVHKHEKAMHAGKPLTKLKKGGVPVHNRNPKIC
jgi:hypothetical protein